MEVRLFASETGEEGSYRLERTFEAFEAPTRRGDPQRYGIWDLEMALPMGEPCQVEGRWYFIVEANGDLPAHLRPLLA